MGGVDKMIVLVDVATKRVTKTPYQLGPMLMEMQRGYGDLWPALSLTKGLMPLKKGSKGDPVKYLQTLLKRLGYDLGTTGPNKDGIDGDFGARTDLAVRAFQQSAGLSVDGIVGKKTWDRLEAATKGEVVFKPTPTPVPTPVPTVCPEGMIWDTISAKCVVAPPPEKEDMFKKMIPYVIIGGGVLSLVLLFKMK